MKKEKKLLLTLVLISTLILVTGCAEKVYDSADLEQFKEVDTKSIKKQKLDAPINDDPRYCSTPEHILECKCQNGYVPVTYNGIREECIPKICASVYGVFLTGTLNSNYGMCEWAVRQPRLEACNSISKQVGKDICVLAYVSRTGEIEKCTQIKDAHLKNECEK